MLMTFTKRSPLLRYLRPVFIGLVCIGVLMAVMAMYLQPTFLLTLANQVWGCF
jgi:hypothetical protein